MGPFRKALCAAAMLAVAFGPAAAQVPPAASHARAAPAEAPAAPRPGGPLAPGQPIPQAELEAFVDGVVRDAMATEHIAGVEVSIVQNGKVVLLKGYGFASLNPSRPVDPSRTLFRIGSLSKTFTWIALMNAADQGRIKLDRPINDYLAPSQRVPDQGFDHPIKVIDLMDHTPGFEDTALGHLFVDKPERIETPDVYVTRHRPRRVREPGQFATYSNYGVALAALAVMHDARSDFPTVIEREITGPLGMSRTTFREPYPARAGLPAPMPAALAADRSSGFHWNGSGFTPLKYEYATQIAGVGDASTTAEDMSRYMLMNLNGGSLEGATVYSPATAQAFRTPLLKVPEGVNGWAHGFMTTSLPGGYTAYGHGGALLDYFTEMMLVHPLNLGVFVTTNTDTGRPLSERLPALIVEHFYASAPKIHRPGDPQLAKHAAVYAGEYLTTRRAYSGLEKLVGLFQGAAKVSVTPDGYLRVFGAGGAPSQWVPEGAPGHFRAAEGDRTMSFRLDARGRAVSFNGASGTQSFERIGALYSTGTLQFWGALALLAALATVIGAFTRIGRDVRPTQFQALSSLIGLGTGVLWLLSFLFFGLFMRSASNVETVIYHWPGANLILASTTALLATFGSVMMLLLLFPAWRNAGRRTDGGWTLWRKLRQSIAAVVFTVFGVLLAFWGALIPWS